MNDIHDSQEPQSHFIAIREEARRFLCDAAQPEHLKSLLEKPGSFDRHSWTSVCALGWPLTPFTEEQGGLGLGWRGLCVLAEELGHKTVSIPLMPTAVIAQILLEQAVDQEGDLASRLISGEQIACLAVGVAVGVAVGAAVAQPGSAGTVFGSTSRFVAGRLQGDTAITPFASCADYALVPAREEEGFCLVLVALRQPQVRVDAPSVIDNSRAAARLHFDAAPARTLVRGELAERRFWQLLGHAALVTSFEQIGGAQACLQMARDYALERKAFGQVIGRFQAIKSKLADMYVRIELARGCASDALSALEQHDPKWEALAAAARVAAIDAYEYCARENIQTHGAIGVTWEAMPHHHYRRSRALALELGAALVWRERLLSQLGFDHAA